MANFSGDEEYLEELKVYSLTWRVTAFW